MVTSQIRSESKEKAFRILIEENDFAGGEIHWTKNSVVKKLGAVGQFRILAGEHSISKSSDAKKLQAK